MLYGTDVNGGQARVLKVGYSGGLLETTPTKKEPDKGL